MSPARRPAPAEVAHDLASGSIHGHRRPSGRRRFRAGRHGGAWIDEGSVGWLVCCTSGDQGGEDPDADPLGAGGHARDRAARRRRDHRLRGVTFLHQPDGALANDLALREHARPRDPDVPSGRGPRHRPGDALLRRWRGEPHGSSGRRDGGRGRGLPGRPQPDGVPGPGPGRPRGPRRPPAVPVLVEPRRTPGSTSGRRWSARSRRSPRTRARSASRRGSPSGSGRGPPRRASRSASAAAEALRVMVIDDDEDEGRRPAEAPPADPTGAQRVLEQQRADPAPVVPEHRPGRRRADRASSTSSPRREVAGGARRGARRRRP